MNGSAAAFCKQDDTTNKNVKLNPMFLIAKVPYEGCWMEQQLVERTVRPVFQNGLYLSIAR